MVYYSLSGDILVSQPTQKAAHLDLWWELLSIPSSGSWKLPGVPEHRCWLTLWVYQVDNSSRRNHQLTYQPIPHFQLSTTPRWFHIRIEYDDLRIRVDIYIYPSAMWQETWVGGTRVRRGSWEEGWWWWRWKREYEAEVVYISLCVATQKQTREGGCVLHNISTYTIKYCFRVSCVSTSWNNTLLMAGLSDVRTYNRPGTQAKVFYLRVASPLGVLTV